MTDTFTATDYVPFATDEVRADSPSNPYRFPIVGSPYPSWYYITAVVVNDNLWEAVMPTSDELRMIGSFHEQYCHRWYGEPHTGFRARMEKRSFDIDGGANGRILIKHADGGGYRLRTWNHGPIFTVKANGTRFDLPTMLDDIHTLGEHLMEQWSEWKADHPDVFHTEAHRG